MGRFCKTRLHQLAYLNTPLQMRFLFRPHFMEPTKKATTKKIGQSRSILLPNTLQVEQSPTGLRSIVKGVYLEGSPGTFPPLIEKRSCNYHFFTSAPFAPPIFWFEISYRCLSPFLLFWSSTRKASCSQCFGSNFSKSVCA